MKQKIVGSYYAGNECVQLVLMEGIGGEFYSVPERGATARIKIGADTDWDCIFGVLFHEIFELLFERLNGRFYPSGDTSQSMASWLFVADHQVFSDICVRAAEYVDECLPDLKKEHKLWLKKVKKKKNTRS